MSGRIWSVASRAGFYASPVLFPVEAYPDDWQFILYLNPLAPLLAQARVWLIDPDAPTYAEAMGGAIYLLGPLLIGLAVCVLGAWYFIRQAPRVAEEL